MCLPGDVEKIHAFLSDLRNKKPEKEPSDIEFGKALKKIPAKFRPDVLNYISYLKETAEKSFLITHRNKETGDEFTRELPYIHRWTEIYRRGFLAKMYQLEEYLGLDVSNATMITLTVSQRGFDPEECLFRLLKNYVKLFKILRKRYGTLDYFYILEPHKTGYPHMHIMYMKTFTDNEKQEIKTIWAEKYGAGSLENGVDFSAPRASDSGEFKSGSISRVRGYLMKYISKSLHAETMQPNELLFNALLKKHNIRLYNCSRNFAKIMKQQKKETDEDIECIKVELLQSGYKEALPEDKAKFSSILFLRGRKMATPMIQVWKMFCTWTSQPIIELYEKYGYKIEFDKIKSLWIAYEPVYVPAEMR